jgi:two-component system chemotaxis response regulator CheB
MSSLRRRTRILIVDDSAVMRSLLRSVLVSDPALEVVATAADGESALAAIATQHPDLVLLDVEMPVMDGLLTLRRMRARGDFMPVIMCSSLTQRGARVTIEALAAGASDYVSKPEGQASRTTGASALAHELLPRIHALAGTEARSRIPFPALSPRLPVGVPIPGPRTPIFNSPPSLLAIGVSTGGLAALDVLLPALPAKLSLPVLIVQHMPELFTRFLAERLNQVCNLPVREATEGEAVRTGVICIARGDWHMEVLPATRVGSPPFLHLSQGALENHCRPAVDVLFRSASAVYGAGVLAVVLTGMGSDGLAGCRILREQGATVLAQDQATSAVWGMPGSVAQAGLAHRVLPLNAIAPEILRLSTRSLTSACDSRRSDVSI